MSNDIKPKLSFDVPQKSDDFKETVEIKNPLPQDIGGIRKFLYECKVRKIQEAEALEVVRQGVHAVAQTIITKVLTSQESARNEILREYLAKNVDIRSHIQALMSQTQLQLKQVVARAIVQHHQNSYFDNQEIKTLCDKGMISTELSEKTQELLNTLTNFCIENEVETFYEMLNALKNNIKIAFESVLKKIPKEVLR